MSLTFVNTAKPKINTKKNRTRKKHIFMKNEDKICKMNSGEENDCHRP